MKPSTATERCVICKREVPENNPFGIYYDPEAEYNVWGGDTYETLGALCEECVENLGAEVRRAYREALREKREREKPLASKEKLLLEIAGRKNRTAPGRSIVVTDFGTYEVPLCLIEKAVHEKYPAQFIEEKMTAAAEQIWKKAIL